LTAGHLKQVHERCPRLLVSLSAARGEETYEERTDWRISASQSYSVGEEEERRIGRTAQRPPGRPRPKGSEPGLHRPSAPISSRSCFSSSPSRSARRLAHPPESPPASWRVKGRAGRSAADAARQPHARDLLYVLRSLSRLQAKAGGVKSTLLPSCCSDERHRA